MEKEIFTKELAEKLMKIKGEGRGVHLKNDAEYILKKDGEEALKKVEQETERLGFPIKYKEIKNTGFYPAGLRAISLLAIKNALDWDDKKMKDMFRVAVGASLIVRVLMKFLHSVSRAVKVVPRMYREYWTEGSGKVGIVNEKEKWATLIIEDFNLHPLYCYCMEGFFEGMVKLVTGAKRTTCHEVKCSFEDNGGKIHEYLVKWE